MGKKIASSPLTISTESITNQNQRVALAACAYAREHIQWGTTHMAYNDYALEVKKGMERAFTSMRQMCRTTPDYFYGIDASLQVFYQTVSVCKQLLLGNCGEFTVMALDYVVNHTEGIDAETYHIKGGDHVFLVIGRERGSDLSDPMTWGESAYICDPWANAVYPASEYLTKLKNFYFKTNPELASDTNYVEDFDPTRHRLLPDTTRTVRYIRYQTLMANRIFAEKAETIIAATDKLKLELMMIARKLEVQYGRGNKKSAIVMQSIRELNEATQALKTDLEAYKQSSTHALKDRLAESLIAHKKLTSSLQKKVFEEDKDVASEIKRVLTASKKTIDDGNQSTPSMQR